MEGDEAMQTAAQGIDPGPTSRRARLRAIAAPAMRAGSLRQRWPAIAAFALLLATLETIRLWSNHAPGSHDFTTVHLPWLAVALPTLGAGAIVGPLIAEAAGWRGARHLALTTAATAAAVGVGAAVLHGVFGARLELAARDGGFASGEALLLRGWWFYSMAGVLFGVFAGSREREFATRSAARAAEIECAGIEHRSLGFELQALAAQLDPRLVFGQLDEIARLYRTDPPRADERLDRLIDYLRSAIPRAPSALRTLDDEATLVAAYLRVAPGSRAPGVEFAIDLDASVRRAPFPRRVLLPLATAAASAGATRITLIGRPGPAGAGAPGVEVTLQASGIDDVAGWTSERCAAAQRTLAAALGAPVTIVQRVLKRGVALTLRPGPRL